MTKTVHEKLTFDQVFNLMMRELPTQMPLREKMKAITKKFLQQHVYKDNSFNNLITSLLMELDS